MSISVQEIVNLPIFNTARDISGIEYLDERHVEWVSAMEARVENFVRTKVLVTTTGMGCEERPYILFEFERDVYESGASAIGIALGSYIFDIRDAIISLATAHQSV